MRSKTFFFNKTIFLKNIKQFWPLWGTYLGLLIITGPLQLFNNYRYFTLENRPGFMYQILSCASGAGLVLAVIFGILSAVAVFSFLYTSKSAGFYSNLPLKRSGLFFTQFMSGLVWLIGSNLITAILLLLVEAAIDTVYFVLTLQWFAITSMYCLFFYGFAVFCAVLTGHNMVAIPLYVVLNFCVVIIERIVKDIMSELIFGVSSSNKLIFKFLSPPYNMLRYTVQFLTENNVRTGVAFENWTSLSIYALVGILFAFTAFLIFRRRHMETASDVVAVNILKPVFRVCMAFGSALCGGFLLHIIFTFFSDCSAAVPLCIYMILSAFIGFFASDMLIEKSFRVFKRRRFIEFTVICSIIILFIAGLEVDLFGIESYIPDAENVDSVEITCIENYFTDDPEIISDVLVLHEGILKYSDYYKSGTYYALLSSLGLIDEDAQIYGSYEDATSCLYYNVYITYQLKNGRSLDRSYSVPLSKAEIDTEGTVGYMLDSILNSTDAIRQRLYLDRSLDSFVSLYTSIDMYDSEKDEYVTFELTDPQARYMYSNLVPVDVESGKAGKLSFAYIANTFSADGSENSTENSSFTCCYIYIDFKQINGSYLTVSFQISDTTSETFKYITGIYKQQYEGIDYQQNIQA